MRSLVEELEILISNTANNNPAPLTCKIHEIYPDGSVDVECSMGLIIYRPCIGKPVIGDEALIVFINGDINQGYVICNGGSGGLSNFNYTVVNGVLSLTNLSHNPVLDFTGLTDDEIILDHIVYDNIDDCSYDFGNNGAYNITIHVGNLHTHILIEDGALVSEDIIEKETLNLTLIGRDVSVEAEKVAFEVFGLNNDGEIILGESTVEADNNGECKLTLNYIENGSYSVTARTSNNHGHMVIL